MTGQLFLTLRSAPEYWKHKHELAAERFDHKSTQIDKRGANPWQTMKPPAMWKYGAPLALTDN